MSNLEKHLREINEKLFVINQKLDNKMVIPAQPKKEKCTLPPIFQATTFVNKLHKIPHDAQKYDVPPSNPK